MDASGGASFQAIGNTQHPSLIYALYSSKFIDFIADKSFLLLPQIVSI